MVANKIIFVIPFGIVAFIGILIFIFSKQITNFVNKIDPLRIGYNKKYFKIIGIITIIVSIIMSIIVLSV